MGMNNKHLWSTQDEIAYIDRLGKLEGRERDERRSLLPRRELLKRYLSGCLMRRVWGRLDKATVILYLRERLEVER